MIKSGMLLVGLCLTLVVTACAQQVAPEERDCDVVYNFFPRDCSISDGNIICNKPSLNAEVFSLLDTDRDGQCMDTISSFSYTCWDLHSSSDLNHVPLSAFHNLNYVELIDCRFDRLYRSALNLSFLTQLAISNSDHQDRSVVIEKSSISQLKQLQQLRLVSMKITTFPAKELCHVNDSIDIFNNLLADVGSLNFGDVSRSESFNHITTCGENLTTLDVSSNLIRTLPSHAFSNLKNLRFLNLKNNILQYVHSLAFVGLFGLEHLDLSSNKISGTLNYTVFENLTRLIYLNISNNNIYSIDSFPKLLIMKELYLGNNNITDVKDGAFLNVPNLKILSLPNNQIYHISKTMFSDLKELRHLDISENAIQHIDFTAFHFGRKLNNLNLIRNHLNIVPDLSFLSNLLELQLSENEISSLPGNCFDNLTELNFLSLAGNRLTELPPHIFANNSYLNTIHLNNNNLSEIPSSLFAHNSDLKVLHLNNNQIRNISTLTYLQTLEYLEIQGNLLDKVYLDEIPKGLVYLNLSRNNMSSLSVSSSFVSNLPYQLSILDVSYNALTDIPLQFMLIELTHLNMSYNHLTNIPVGRFKTQQKLEEVDFRHNEISLFDRDVIIIPLFLATRFFLEGNLLNCDCRTWWLLHNVTRERRFKFGEIADLELLRCSVPVLNSTEFEVLNVVQVPSNRFLCEFSSAYSHFNSSHSEHHDKANRCDLKCHCYFNHDFSFVVTSCSSEEFTVVPLAMLSMSNHIYLDGNNIVYLNNSDLWKYTKTTQLYINNSFVETIEDAAFMNMTSLEELHLEGNNLHYIREKTFEGLYNLSKLFLHANLLQTIHPFSFLKLSSITLLSLHANSLTSFPPFDLYEAKTITSLTLSQNPWDCHCSNDNEVKQKINLLNQFSSKILDSNFTTCHQPKINPSGKEESGVNLFKFYSDMCNFGQLFPVVEILMPVSVMMVVGLVAILTFVYRFEVQVLIYSRYEFRLFRKSNEMDKDQDKNFDAFVAYSNQDEEFVVRELLPRLEGGERPFRLCLHHRDFLVGGFITNSILEAIDCSRRTIVVMSDHFSNSNWCRFEFKSAHVKMMEDRCPRLIMIVLGDVPEDLDPEVNLYFKTNTYLQYGDKLFWEKLNFAMPSRGLHLQSGQQVQNISDFVA